MNSFLYLLYPLPKFSDLLYPTGSISDLLNLLRKIKKCFDLHALWHTYYNEKLARYRQGAAGTACSKSVKSYTVCMRFNGRFFVEHQARFNLHNLQKSRNKLKSCLSQQSLHSPSLRQRRTVYRQHEVKRKQRPQYRSLLVTFILVVGIEVRHQFQSSGGIKPFCIISSLFYISAAGNRLR